MRPLATPTPARRSWLPQRPVNRADDGDASTAPKAEPLFPLASPEGATRLLDERRLNQLILAFIVLGVAARCIRYFLRFPLWEDECFLNVNLIDRDFAGLMRPLDFHQVAPVFFLWVQHAVVSVLGYHELSLRLIPFLAGLGSMGLFYRLACRCLTGLPRLLAVAVFSVSYATIRYSAEAKPYGVDLFVALVLVTFTVNWLQQPGRSRWLWWLAAAMPLAVGLSYPAVMLGGGLCLAIAWVVWRQRRWDSFLAWAVFTAALLASFGGLYLLSVRNQEASELVAMREMWKEHFPPWNNLLEMPYWLLHTHTGDLLAWPVGGSPHQSSLSALCWFAALIALARRRQGWFLILCLAPLAVNFVAASMQRFPYGGHARLNLWIAPLLCLLIGYGMTVLLEWVARRGWRPGPWLATVLALLALTGAATAVRDLAGPYKNISDEQQRAFAQWFWYNAESEAEVADIKTDLGRDFSPKTYQELCFVAEHLCNRRIYSPRRSSGEPIHWDRISATHPLRCVLYRAPAYPFDEDAFQSWLREMQETYDLVSRDRFPQVRLKNTGKVSCVDYVEIFCFVPKTERAAAVGASGD
jgi:Dolichyl-phosphate-mannose-protein mannosyltransferase